MRGDARYASRLNLTLSPKENLRPLQAKPEEGSNICKNTIHAAFLPHNPFLPTLRRCPLFLLRTELWGQRTNSTHDSSSIAYRGREDGMPAWIPMKEGVVFHNGIDTPGSDALQ
jgi:hypothetical protein